MNPGIFIRKFLSQIILLALLVPLAACAPAKASQQEDPIPVKVGMDSTAVNSLIMIADSQNFFTENGLQVEIITYPSGLAASDALLKNEVDVATASEFVLVGKAFAKAPLRTWGSIDKFMHNYLIAKKDHGIETIGDLRGKKIGFPFKTAAEFYLGRFLDLNGMSLRDITPVNISPADLVNAFVSGDVDAVVAWQPNAKTIEDRLGNDILVWPAQNDQVAYANLVSTDEWTGAHPEAIRRFLRALIEAEAFYADHPAEARAVLQKKMSYSDAFITAVLPEHQFQVSLDQSLILAMEDEARWMITNHMVADQETPVFLNSVYLDGMQSVRPDSVNIIR